MEYVKLGRTGLEVSRLCLGCMAFGTPGQGLHPWALPEEPSRPLLKKALDHGINFFDTSDFYSYGQSEEALGDAVHNLCRREEVVISTKVGMMMGNDVPNERGVSRKRIREAIDASLRRLKTDYVDVYLLHLWDPTTPLEETIEAMEDLVRAGKILYYGACNYRAWQLAQANHHALTGRGKGPVTTQFQYNLAYREEERELMPYCEASGMGAMVYSPLARGWLVGGDRSPDQLTERERARVQGDVKSHALYGRPADQLVRDRLMELASQRGVPPGRVAMAWVLSKSQVSTALVGALEPSHLLEAVAALDVVLSPEDQAYLEEPYQAGALRTEGLKQIMAQQRAAAGK